MSQKDKWTSPRSHFVLTKSHFWCSSSESLGRLPGLLGIRLSAVWISHVDLGERPWLLGLLGSWLENKTLLRYSG